MQPQTAPPMPRFSLSRFETSIAHPAMSQTAEVLGHRLSFAERGPRGAPPVFYFHGWPGSRLETAIFDLPDLHVISVDRPGYGGSPSIRGRTLADWPRMIESLADHLKLDRFTVIGISGGAPYALACAAALPSRVTKVVEVCGLGPPDAPGMNVMKLSLLQILGSHLRRTGSLVFDLWRRAVLTESFPERFSRLYQFRNRHVPVEQQLMTRDFAAALIRSWADGLRTTTEGMSSDARIYGQPWFFGLEDIQVPAYVWHGEEDDVVPVSIGRFVAGRLPDAQSTFVPGTGHFSVVMTQLESILEVLRAR